jgi:hypothetical protein
MRGSALRALRDDLMVSSGALQMKAGDYLERLRSRARALLPQDLGGGSAQHFSSVYTLFPFWFRLR